MPNIPLIARHRGSSACGVPPQDASHAAYHTRTPERAPYRGGKRGVPWLHTLCGVRYAMPHRVSTPPEQGSPRYGGDRIASIRIGRCVAAEGSAHPSFVNPSAMVLGGCPRNHQADFSTYSCQTATRRG